MPTLIRTLKRITAPPNESSKIVSPEVVQSPQNNLTDLVHRDRQLGKNEATSSHPSDNTTSSQKAITANDTSDGISAAANSYKSYVQQSSDRKQKSSSADSDEELSRKRAGIHAKATPDECTNWGVNRGATLSSSSSRQCINEATTDEGLRDRHSAHGNETTDRGEKKRAFPSPSGDSIDGKEIKKRNRICHQKSFVIDLSDVPPQQPIPKSKGRTNNASKYAGASFNKQVNKWYAKIMIEGKTCQIGYYESEEEAAVDYARAVFKCKGGARQQSFLIDLKDVPTQLPIPKSASRIKEGASKYAGVTFHKLKKKWHAQITIEGKQISIGTYDNEEEAAVDYARAVLKYRGQEALDEARERKGMRTLIRTPKRITAPPNEYSKIKSPEVEVVQLPQNNLTDLVHRDSQLKKNEATSSDPSDNTTAITANDISNGISAVVNSYESYVRQSDRKQNLSSADSDEELPRKRATIHAKAAPNGCTNWDVNRGATLSSFRGCVSEASTDEGLCDRHSTHGNKTDRGAKKRAFPSGDSIDDKEIKKRQKMNAFVIDLSDVPPQQPIPKSRGRTNNASKYAGVSFSQRTNKWIAQIMIKGKPCCIGSYDNEEEAAVDYARAIFKYKGGAHQQSLLDDLKDVPIQSPILKSASRIKEGASKYAGVTFNKKVNKWQAQIQMEGKTRRIRYYEDEEEAAVDYARAIFKYRGQGALDKAKNQS
eukprot:scaffold1907_cov73-Skeletonema_dohrnii-CCMP3373.AAC.10